MTDTATTTPLEPAAFNELLAAWYVRPNTFAQARNLTRDTDRAKELVQETTVKLMEKREYFEAGSNFIGWAATVMYHVFIAGLRRGSSKKRRAVMIEPDAPELASEVALQVFPHQQSTVAAREMFRVFSAHCNKNEGHAILMQALGGMSVEEIAVVQRVDPGTVKARMSRARRRMIKEYEREA